MEPMKTQRCYQCGSRFNGPSCPHCDHAVDFHDMDMRVVDYLRLLGFFFLELIGSLANKGSKRSGAPGTRQGPLQPPGKRPKGGLNPQQTC